MQESPVTQTITWAAFPGVVQHGGPAGALLPRVQWEDWSPLEKSKVTLAIGHGGGVRGEGRLAWLAEKGKEKLEGVSLNVTEIVLKF